MLTGGTNVVPIDVDIFYNHWMSCQKDWVYLPRVCAYKEKILSSSKIAPPLLHTIDVDDEGKVGIRTLDGRHRIAAAKAAGITTIYVRMSDELLLNIKELFPGIIQNNTPLAQNNFEEDDDHYENLRFFQAFIEKNRHFRAKPDTERTDNPEGNRLVSTPASHL